MFVIFIFHHLLNINWHKNLLKGKYNAVRIIGTLINVGIFICMIFSAVSGVLLSQYAFSFLDFNQGISFARTAHMICTHWMFVLTAFHLGMHLTVMKAYIEQVSKRNFGKIVGRILQMLFAVVSVYGVIVFIETELWQYMFYQTQYMYYDFSRMAVTVYLDHVAMMVLFAVIGYILSYTMKKISRTRSR